MTPTRSRRRPVDRERNRIFTRRSWRVPRPERSRGDRSGARPTACPRTGSRPPANRRSGRWRWSGRSPSRSIPNTGPCRWSGTFRRCRRSRTPPRPARSAMDGEMPDVRSLRIPVKYLANMLTAGDEAPVVLGARAHAGDARLYASQDRRRRDRRWHGRARRPDRRIRSRTCIRSWRSPITRIALSSRPPTARWSRMPMICAAAAASPTATAARRACRRAVFSVAGSRS